VKHATFPSEANLVLRRKMKRENKKKKKNKEEGERWREK
jgi:hypothetical protein